MSRFLSSLGLVIYIAIAAYALLWWAPNFFAANLHLYPELNYRYIAATGIPFALMMVTVAARQSLLPQFSLILILQVLAAIISLSFCVMSFQYLPQAVFFCALHLALCAVFFAWNLNTYRRDLKAWKKRREALTA